MRRMRPSNTFRAVAVAAGVAASTLAGCSSNPLGKSGNLANGGFTYECVDVQDDHACAQLAINSMTTFPSDIAVGSQFRVSFTPKSDQQQNAGNPQLRPVAADYLVSTADGQFKALKAGYCAIVARSSKDGTVIDYTLVHMTNIADIAMTADGSTVGNSGASPFSVGASVELKATPVDERGQPVDGTLDYVWTIDDTSVATFQSPINKSASASLQGVKAGTTTLHIQSGDAKRDVQITVR